MEIHVLSLSTLSLLTAYIQVLLINDIEIIYLRWQDLFLYFWIFMSIYILVWIVETFSYIQNVEYKNSDQTSKDIAVLVLTIFGSLGSSFCGIN